MFKKLIADFTFLFRRSFLHDISRRLVSAKSNDFTDVISGPHPQKIKFLEANLEQLTSAHKALVRENYELKSQTPRLEARLNATLNRCKKLEQTLKHQKEQINKVANELLSLSQN